jgi:hypothetical protein
MLPPFIIEQIRRREEQERARHEQPRIELPLDRTPEGSGRHGGVDRPAPRTPPAPEEPGERGVVIIDLTGD